MMRAEEVFARYKEEIGEAVIFSPKIGGYSTITFPLYGPDGDYFDLYFKVDGKKVLIESRRNTPCFSYGDIRRVPRICASN